MAKLYIFAIGGTGSRVLRSLTMLLASGVKLAKDVSEVIPVIIDPDQANGDLTRTVGLMNRYIDIRKQLTFPIENKNNFFRTDIKRILQNFTLPIANTNNNKFRDFIGLATMSKESQAMMHMLFSESNLESSMNVGFKGNPNIGSVVLNQIAASSQFNQLANTFQSGDKIFIISSIFGGTGAAGFPLLLKTLRSNHSIPNYAAINNATIGAVTVLPYFKVKHDSESAIDSSTFISKTKSALQYYEQNIINNKDVDALYFLADEQNNTYENREGQAAQINDAHLIELLAASAIIDFTKQNFVNREDPEFISWSPLNMEFGIKDAELSNTSRKEQVGTLTLDSFYMGSKDTIYRPLTQMILMANAFENEFEFISSATFDANRKLKLTTDFYNSSFVKDLHYFLESYKNWLQELKNNRRSLNIFNLDCGKKPFDVLTDKKEKKYNTKLIGLFNKDYNLFSQFLNKATSKVNSKNDYDRLLELYSIATDKMITEKLNF